MGRRGTPERREPRLGRDYDAEEREERRAAGRERARKPAQKTAGKRKRRPLLWRLVQTGLVMGVWLGVAGAAVIAYEAAQLPPIDQLAIPKRPPNIAIMAEDGSLLANRGDTGGAAVRLNQLPPYVPQAFVSIEDRRF
jgi:penicillin-binding protein 1A